MAKPRSLSIVFRPGMLPPIRHASAARRSVTVYHALVLGIALAASGPPATRAGATPIPDDRRVPVLSDLPVLGRLFLLPGPPAQGVPGLKDLPFLGRLFRFEPQTAVGPGERAVPVLSDLPFLGRLFRP